MKGVTVIAHPLVQHNLARLRDERTQLFQFTIVLGADDFSEEVLDHLLGIIPRGDSNDCIRFGCSAGL